MGIQPHSDVLVWHQIFSGGCPFLAETLQAVKHGTNGSVGSSEVESDHVTVRDVETEDMEEASLRKRYVKLSQR